MNEYSRELMHMTTSEKADYNRRYYQRNKQYWKDYYKTGQGRGRSTAVASGTRNDSGHSGGGSHWRTDNGTSNSRGYGGGGSSFDRNHSGGGSSFDRNHSGGGSSFKRSHSGGGSSWDLSGGLTEHVSNPWYNPTRTKEYYTMPDGRVRVKSTSWDKHNTHANTQTPYHTNGKSLDDHGYERFKEAHENWDKKNAAILRTAPGSDAERIARARESGAFGDFVRELHGNDSYQYGKVRPHTANIPRKKIDRIMQSASKTVKEIKEEAGFAASAAKDFAKKIFDEIDYQVWNVGDEIKKTVKKIKRR